MKKQLLLILLAIVGMSYSSVSYAQITNEIAGTYNGTLEVTVEKDTQSLDQAIILTATGEDKINLSIDNFTFPIMGTPVPIGTITIENIQVVVEENVYKFEGSSMIPMKDIIGADLEAEIEGMVDEKGMLSLNLSIENMVEVVFKDGVKEISPAESIAGTYNGTLEVTVEKDTQSLDQAIILTATGEDKINLSIDNFTFPIMGTPVPIGTITIENIQVVVEENVYKFEGSSMIPMKDIIGADLEAEIEGMVDEKGMLSLNLSIENMVEVVFKDGVKETVGISIIEKKVDFSIYPTTTYDVLNILGEKQNSKYYIYNIAGLLVKTGIVESEISVSGLNKGMYLINIDGYSVKFIKK